MPVWGEEVQAPALWAGRGRAARAEAFTPVEALLARAAARHEKPGFMKSPSQKAQCSVTVARDGAGCRFSGPRPGAFGFWSAGRFSVLPSVLVPLGEP